MEVTFYPLGEIRQEEIAYVVMLSRYKKQWIIVRHKERTTWEVPGGRREPLEELGQAARRELFEETGARKFQLFPVGVYSVSNGKKISFGKLFYVEVSEIGELPDSEIGEIRLIDELPQENLTYPHIQPFLFRKTAEFLVQHAEMPDPSKGNKGF